jgi:hypothetical protein
MKIKRVFPAVCVALGALLVGVPAAQADQSHHGDDRHEGRDRCARMVGTWNTTLSPFGTYAMFVFNEDHTLTSTTSNSSGLTSGSGVWEATRDGHCAAIFEGFSDNDLDGTFDTRFQIRTTLQVRGNRIKGTVTFDVLDLDGTFLLNAFTGLIIEGERMKVIRE